MANYFLFKTIPNGKNRLAENSSVCELDQQALLAREVELNNLNFSVQKDFEKYDFLETDLPGIKLCSKKVVSVLQEHKIQGWAATEVTLVQGGKILDNKYFLFHVYGKCGPFDYSKSEIVGRVANSFTDLKGRYFDESTINRNDIFVPESTLMIFTNDKVKNLMMLNKITNVSFTLNSEFVSSVSVRIYNPGKI